MTAATINIADVRAFLSEVDETTSAQDIRLFVKSVRDISYAEKQSMLNCIQIEAERLGKCGHPAAFYVWYTRDGVTVTKYWTFSGLTVSDVFGDSDLCVLNNGRLQTARINDLVTQNSLFCDVDVESTYDVEETILPAVFATEDPHMILQWVAASCGRNKQVPKNFVRECIAHGAIERLWDVHRNGYKFTTEDMEDCYNEQSFAAASIVIMHVNKEQLFVEIRDWINTYF